MTQLFQSIFTVKGQHKNMKQNYPWKIKNWELSAEK